MNGTPPIEKIFPEVATYNREDFVRIGTSRPALMIAITARTGSEHLCSALSSVLPIGRPIELFNARDTLPLRKKQRGIHTFAELLTQYFSESPEMVVFKTSWLDFEYFKDWIFDLFPNLKIVYLNRLDVEAQAVSLAIAVLSGKWHARFAGKAAKMPPEEIVKQFDLVSVCRRINALNMQKSGWENFFFEHELQPFRINYESLKFNLHSAVRQIASYIGYPDTDLSNLKSEFKVTFDSSNNVWLKIVRNYRNGNFYANVLTEDERSKLLNYSDL